MKKIFKYIECKLIGIHHMITMKEIMSTEYYVSWIECTCGKHKKELLIKRLTK